MRIAKIKIENFRNIKSLEFNVENATIISGENELGKSNALNALVWFYTDTIYTDNSGVGENDINSIVPKNQQKGEHTSVSVEFVNGPTFTKMYKTGYDRATGKANKHTTEGYINSVGTKNMQEWNSKLMEALEFTPTFTSVKELNLFIDPLYALQKLDAKQLRTLLVSFGCTATNEEMYKLGFEDLRPYESKYLGDFVNMRVDLKKQVKVIKDSVNRFEILLQQFNEIAEFDQSALDTIVSDIDELTNEKNKLINNTNDDTVKELTYKLKSLINDLEVANTKAKNDINSKIKDLTNKKHLEEDTLHHQKELATKELILKVNELENEVYSYSKTITTYESAIDTFKRNLERTQMAAKSALNKKSDYQARLIATKEKAFEGYITCPECGSLIVANPEAKEKFEADKENDIQFYTNEIASLNKHIEDYQIECKKIIEEAKTTKVEMANVEVKMTETRNRLAEEKERLYLASHAPVDMTKIENLNIEIKELEMQLMTIPSVNDNEEVIALKKTIEEAKTSGKLAVMEEVNTLNAKLDALEEQRESLYIERSSWNQKIEYQKNLAQAIEKLNDTEALIERVNDFIHSMIKLINDKAKAKTGMDFVMLEENLGNDGVKEVCYAVVDGVPFAMINTAKKYIYGIKFIEKVKDIAVNDFGKNRNDLPILADKFEGIDHIEKIKSLSSEQLICTRVGLENRITIL